MNEEARKREDDYYAGTMKDDYISRKAVLDMLNNECGSCADTGYIFSLPGIEAQRGKWNKVQRTIRPWKAFRCSECKHLNEFPSDYCPNCGADMRGETDE